MILELPDFLENPNPDVYLSDNFVVVDFETAGTSFGIARVPENRLVMASWWDEPQVEDDPYDVVVSANLNI